MGTLKPINCGKRITHTFKPIKMSWNVDLANQLHARVIRNFPRRNLVSTSTDSIWSCDLLDLVKYSRSNNGMRYILVCVDLFSRFLWMRALKNKTGEETKKAFMDIFNSGYRPTKALYTDKGAEFLNKGITSLLKQYNLKIYHTYGEMKSSLSERAIRTIKLWIYKIFTATNKTKWLPYLKEVENKYNETKQRKLSMSPLEARKPINNNTVFLGNLKRKKITKRGNPYRFRIGDHVRISRVKGVFSKSYRPQWSSELFEVSKIIDSEPQTYQLTDMNNEIIAGSFYSQEIKIGSTNTYYYKILKKRNTNGVAEVYVKWKGFDESHNKWMRTSEIVPPKKRIKKVQREKREQKVKAIDEVTAIPMRRSERIKKSAKK